MRRRSSLPFLAAPSRANWIACVPPRFRTAGSLSLSSPQHDVSIAVANPSCRRRHPDPHAGCARQRSSSRRTRASPSPQKSEAAYAVAYGNLIGGQLLALRLHQPLDRQAGLGKPLLNPGERQRQSGPCPATGAQVPRQTNSPSAGSTRHIRDCQDQAFRVFLRDLRHLVCQ